MRLFQAIQITYGIEFSSMFPLESTTVNYNTIPFTCTHARITYGMDECSSVNCNGLRMHETNHESDLGFI